MSCFKSLDQNAILHEKHFKSTFGLNQRVLGLTWRPRRMSFFVDQKPENISKNDSNTI